MSESTSAPDASPPDRRWRLPEWLTQVQADPTAERSRIRAVECDIGLPVRGMTLLFLAISFFWSPWYAEAGLFKQGVHEVIRVFFVIYLAISVIGGILIASMQELPFRVVRETVLVLSVTDTVFMGALTVVAGGYDSTIFWLFVVFIVRNALVMPDAGRQIMANLLVIATYAGAGIAEGLTTSIELDMLDPALAEALYPAGPEAPAEPVILKLLLLILLTICCYGVEVLFDRQRILEEEAREFAARQHQLASAGRMAAEIAHQLKNPLGIINNAAYALQRTVREGKTITQQIEIIRHEVERSDRIITDLMGYSRLVEGRVERIDVVQELEQALREVFPPEAQFDIRIRRSYTPGLPVLLAQRAHIAEIFLNLLQNAREATGGRATLFVTTGVTPDFSIRIVIEDDGPGISPELRDRIFEAYYTTKTKGSGLGLAIVRHNTELYGGSVTAESDPGKGARFILEFPARTVVRLRR